MKEFITKNFSVLLITLLILFLWNKGAFKNTQNDNKPVIVFTSDTTNKNHEGSHESTPQQVQYIPYPVEKITTQVIQDTNYVKQIIADYMSRRIQQDSIIFKDSLGYVKTTDTVSNNRIIGRKWDYNVKERIVTNTITITQPYKPKSQLYYGFELTSPFAGTLGIEQAQVGIQLKNKKDNILKLSTGYNFFTHSPIISLGYYQKLSFHK